ncbi:MAG TPA: MOSC domain-containing protein [Acidimicrobiia bacterium]|jgi:MOSC domain-containing protein YiiM|nr:MOSC domain-containing protein [Acidimicrobiia bacterium]
MGTVERVFVAMAGGEAMQAVDEVQAVAGRGLDGDRYATRRGYWTDIDECQVTLIQGEDLDAVAGSAGVAVEDGQHRRNIVTRGVDLRALAGRRFRIGDATFTYDRPRPPCRYIESLTEPGMTRALAARRGGICARVVESGLVRPGDAIELLPADDGVVAPRPGPVHRAANR